MTWPILINWLGLAVLVAGLILLIRGVAREYLSRLGAALFIIGFVIQLLSASIEF